MDRLIARIAPWPIGGAVISLMAVLAHWGQNPLRLGFENAWPTMLVAVLIALTFAFLFRLMSGSWARAGIATAFTAFYIFYIPVLIAQLRISYTAAALLHVGAIGSLLLLWLRFPRDSEKFARIAGRLNLVFMLLLAVSAIPIVTRQVSLELVRANALASLPDFKGSVDANSPDVWHIIFDRYADQKTLRSRYAFDNAPFVNALRARGFVIKDSAYSNYQRTGHSVASTMNGTLLDPIAEKMASEPTDWVPIYRAMRNNAAIRFFDRIGYETIFAGSWWEPTRFSSAASNSIRIRALPQLARVALDRSAVGFWMRGVSMPWLDGRGDQCFRANEKFRRLRELAQDQSRKYVFAHFLVPHPPFVLDEDGNCRSLQEATRASRRDNYISQIKFANRNALDLVDAIIASKRPSIIVIHSDEGPWPSPYVGYEHGLGTDPVPVPWEDLSTAELQEKMGILLAVRTPSAQPSKGIPESPVQIYPIILRDYFSAQIEIPDPKQFVYKTDSNIYIFKDVSISLE